MTETEYAGDGHSLQAQHVGRFGNLTTVAGLASDRLENRQQSTITILLPPPFDPLILAGPVEKHDAEHRNVYGYGTLRLAQIDFVSSIEITGGLSVDTYDDGISGGRDSTEVNPKLGARINMTDDIALRGAYTRSLKPLHPFDQRLKPMTVAGFAQYVDQFNGATVEQAAGGLDARVMPGLWLGVEGARRWIETETGGKTYDTWRPFGCLAIGDSQVAGTLTHCLVQRRRQAWQGQSR